MNIKNGVPQEGSGSTVAETYLGDVVGPGSSTDNAVARFDQATGKLIQNSVMTVNDAGSVNIPAGETYKINNTPHTHPYGDVTGPGSATDNAVARFDLTTGKLVQSSNATLSDGGSFNIPSGQTYNINGAAHGHTNLSIPSSTELTISSGAITVTQFYHTIDTEGDGASDDLDTINGGSTQNIVVIRAIHTDRTVVIKHNTGNILCGSDISLDETYKAIMLIYDSALTKWIPVSKF